MGCLKQLKHKLDDFAKLDSINQSAGVFVNGQLGLKPDYIESAKKELDSIIDSINVNDPSASAAKINKWVSTQTGGKIDDLIKPDVINAQTLAILMSTTLFKGQWAEKFERIDDQTFHGSMGAVKTPFMRLKKKKHFSAFVDDGLKLVGIPYEDDMMMTIAMPEGNLSAFEEKLKGPNALVDLIINQWENDPHPKKVEVMTMPLFSVKSEFNMKDIFTKLGHGKLFDPSIQHNYSNMTDKDVFISDAIHQATIEVDEIGTVAAAGTRVSLEFKSFSTRPPLIIT